MISSCSSEKQQRFVAMPNSVSGKTARACDSCVRRRARWYCAADDAFLCQICDTSVHSANPLARRHQRIRLKTASSAGVPACKSDVLVPAWLTGFKRKARTPRLNSSGKMAALGGPREQPMVPELVETSTEEENGQEEEEEQLVYRVPIFDPDLAEFCFPPPSLDDSNTSLVEESKPVVEFSVCTPASTSSNLDAANRVAGTFLPSDIELAEFAANMESLLGGGIDGTDDSFCMEKLGLVEPMEDDANGCFHDGGRVKAEQPDEKNGGCQVELEIDESRETLEINFNWDPPTTGDEEAEEEKLAAVAAARKAKLRLDYQAVITAWSRHGSLSPWTDGKRPQISLDNCWPDYVGLWMGVGGGVQIQGTGHCGETGAVHGDGGREARVSRYREKRRTRLFSKKIRYEVRKLNAEKRPRMKGRFVKRVPGLVAFAL